MRISDAIRERCMNLNMWHCDDSKLVERETPKNPHSFFFTHRDQIQGTQTVWLYLWNHHLTSHVLRNIIIESTTMWLLLPFQLQQTSSSWSSESSEEFRNTRVVLLAYCLSRLLVIFAAIFHPVSKSACTYSQSS